MMVLLPCDVLRPRRVDEHFAAEADAARDAGLDVALVDHDALGTADGAARAVARVPQAAAGSRGVYRGWMLSAERYAAFAAALAAREVLLCTGAEQYRRAHELPGWYPALEKLTPRSVWTTGADPDGFAEACRELGSGPAVLRDYTKSMKHYWHEAAFIPDLEDMVAAWTVASQRPAGEHQRGHLRRRALRRVLRPCRATASIPLTEEGIQDRRPGELMVGRCRAGQNRGSPVTSDRFGVVLWREYSADARGAVLHRVHCRRTAG
jgi:hypothetical protein